MTKNALRVIGCGYKTDRPSAKLSESELVFVGLIGISDPPRPEAVDAVKTCNEAGIRTVMITGDHAKTALAIAKKTGICTERDTAITGAQLEKMTDEQLREAVKNCNVYARVSPSHKSRIVTAMQENGSIVAMTGDGINDAPALKKADIGCSMGITGTEVAKSASDIILTDDNFATIVYAVKEGRCIYDNIKKSVKFLLSSNIGEILTVLFGILFGCRSPLNAIELLWINLVTDSFPAIALGLDSADKDIMKRKPLDPKKGIFSGDLWASIVFEGLMIGALSLLAYKIGHVMFAAETIARTMAFFVLSVSQLTHAFNMRSEKSVLNKNIAENKYLVFSFIAGFLIQLVLIYTDAIAKIFGLCALSATALIICIVLSIMPLVIVESQKALNIRMGR
jgi:Ca2+-transporting ATPase